MAKKKMKAIVDEIDAMRYISREFMALSDKGMIDLDKRIDRAIIQAKKEMEQQPMLKNDHYLTDNVVMEADGGDKDED